MTTLTDRTHADSALNQSLREAAQRHVSKEEVYRQRVNYIVGAMNDEKTKITPEMVKQELDKLAGIES